MAMSNKITVSLHTFDVHGNCYADIILPLSKKKIADFRVMKQVGGVIVNQPAYMGKEWKIDEISWIDVRNQIAEEYLHNNNSNSSARVSFHRSGEKSDYIANIAFPDYGIIMNDFIVKPGPSGGVLVHMPSWMRGQWDYTEIQWSEVRQIITKEYLSFIASKDEFKNSNNVIDISHICNFHSFAEKTEAFVSVTNAETNEQIQGIKLLHKYENDLLRIFMPKEMNGHWDKDFIEWDRLVELIKQEYRRQVLGTDVDDNSGSEELKIVIYSIQKVIACKADVKLPHNNKIIRGFTIKRKKGDQKITVLTPKWMTRWNDNKLKWNDLRKIITDEYNRYVNKQNKIEEISSVENDQIKVPESEQESIADENKKKQNPKETNKFGRIMNAENSPFVFYPRTVLRAVDFSETKGKNANNRLISLVKALNRGSFGGIGPFEINILEWISKLRFVTSTMLLDLIKAGYVSFGWRSDITQDKLSKITKRMASYDLITLTRFVTLKDDGGLETDTSSIMRVITLGKNGSSLLHELYRKTAKYNPFDIFQDGNTVKRFLISNQWLIYWLKTYKEEIGEDYETSCIIHLKGIEYIGARIYAIVTINDRTLIAEPVRRVEAFEMESCKQLLIDKIKRLAIMFNNLDQLYQEQSEISFPNKPIIILICEDDNHIFEIWKSLKLALPEIYDQEIWFSTDLRLYNYNQSGERFFRISNDDILRPVDLRLALGIDNEGDQV